MPNLDQHPNGRWVDRSATLLLGWLSALGTDTVLESFRFRQEPVSIITGDTRVRPQLGAMMLQSGLRKSPNSRRRRWPDPAARLTVGAGDQLFGHHWTDRLQRPKPGRQC